MNEIHETDFQVEQQSLDLTSPTGRPTGLRQLPRCAGWLAGPAVGVWIYELLGAGPAMFVATMGALAALLAVLAAVAAERGADDMDRPVRQAQGGPTDVVAGDDDPLVLLGQGDCTKVIRPEDVTGWRKATTAKRRWYELN